MVLRYSLSVIKISYTRLSRSLAVHSGTFYYRDYIEYRLPCNPTKSGLAWSAFAHRYWRNLIWFIFLALLRCFSSRRSQPDTNTQLFSSSNRNFKVSLKPKKSWDFMCGPPVKQERFPHSETAGSKVDGTSPTSIAAVCVFPRSKSPRHPLLALVVNLFILRLASELRRFLSRIMPWTSPPGGQTLRGIFSSLFKELLAMWDFFTLWANRFSHRNFLSVSWVNPLLLEGLLKKPTLVDRTGIEPATSSVQMRRSTRWANGPTMVMR